MSKYADGNMTELAIGEHILCRKCVACNQRLKSGCDILRAASCKKLGVII